MIEAKEALEILTKGAKITLLHTGRDARFRVDAQVIADDIDVGAELIHMGLAVPYDGKKARTKDWCTK